MSQAYPLVRTDMDEEEYVKVVASLPLYNSSSAQGSVADSHGAAPGSQRACASSAGGCSSSTENRIRALHKKLDQIVELKAKKAKGAVLERNQVRWVVRCRFSCCLQSQQLSLPHRCEAVGYF